MRYFYLVLLFLGSMSMYAQHKHSGHLFVLLGQSNMSGRAPVETSDTASLSKVMLLNDEGHFEVAKNPLNRYSNIRKDIKVQRLGPGYSFAKVLSQQLQDTIYLVVNARGGTALERFMKNDSTGYYDKIIDRVKQAMQERPEAKLEAIIWHQGESNRDDYENYLIHLKKMVTDLRKDLGAPDLPFVAGEIGRWNSDYIHIVKQIALIPDRIPNAWLVSSEGLANIDKYHFDAHSQRILGKRYAEKFMEIINKGKK